MPFSFVDSAAGAEGSAAAGAGDCAAGTEAWFGDRLPFAAEISWVWKPRTLIGKSNLLLLALMSMNGTAYLTVRGVLEIGA